MKFRIIKNGDLFEIQKPRRDWRWRETGQWETIGNPDFAAVYSDLEDALRQIAHWEGKDANSDKVVWMDGRKIA